MGKNTAKRLRSLDPNETEIKINAIKDLTRKSYKDILFKPNIKANHQRLIQCLQRGFKPKWYIVLHFNDGGGSKKEEQRRLDPDEIKKDLSAVKTAIYTELYGKKWKKNKRRARSIWTIEYGANQERPHTNLLIEDIPYSKFRFEWFLNHTLPKDKVRCLWKQSAHMKPVFDEEGITAYICKESNFLNSTIVYDLCDFIK